MPSAGVDEILPEVHEGERLSAKYMNLMASMAMRANRFNRGAMRTLSNGAGDFTVPDPEAGIVFYNGAGSTVPAYGVMLQNGIQNIEAIKIKCPDIFGCQQNFLVNSGDAVTDTTYGYAQEGFGNVYIAAYDSADGTPSQDESWGPRSGTYLLKKNTGGFRIVGIYDSTNHYAWVRSEPMYRVLAKTTATINAKSSDASGCTIYTGAPGTEVTTGVSIVGAYNYSNCAINSGKFVFLDWAWWYGTLTQPIYITLADTTA